MDVYLWMFIYGCLFMDVYLWMFIYGYLFMFIYGCLFMDVYLLMFIYVYLYLFSWCMTLFSFAYDRDDSDGEVHYILLPHNTHGKSVDRIMHQ
jgi:hypothetical protein